MGWKNVKEHYRIEHTVKVADGKINIGSHYISDLIVIDQTGQIIKRYDERGNANLRRYQQEMDADSAMLCRLIETPDQFEKSILVYTYQGSEIIEKLCEKPGWPNVTHDGDLMYENTFSTNRQTVIEWAKRNAAAGVEMCRRLIKDAEDNLAKLKAEQAECDKELQKLNEMYPEAVEKTN